MAFFRTCFFFWENILDSVLQLCLTLMTNLREEAVWKNTKGATIDILARAKRCLNLYNNINQGMGGFLFLFMSLNQIAIIFYLFITITTLLDGKSDISNLCFGIGFGFGTLALAISVVSVTLALDGLVFEKYVDEIIEGGGIFIKESTRMSLLPPKLADLLLLLSSDVTKA